MMPMHRLIGRVLTVAALLVCCITFADDQPAVVKAVAVVHPLGDAKVHGVVRFSQTDDGVQVVADLQGLEPNSVHGFHIHEFGDCSSADGSSAGGHYNPEKHQHGKPGEENRHGGDMGNVQADGDGKVHLDLVMRGLTIAGARNPIIGRAVIIHAKADDFSQPVGNAGARIGCGVIGIGK